MGLRDTINRNPLIAGIAAAVLVAFAGWIAYRSATDKGLTREQPTQYYFTTDDGKTYFAAPTTRVPPFDKDGKPAVLAHVFTCDRGNTKFVGYLTKYNDSFAKKAAEEMSGVEQSGKPLAGGGLLTSSAAAMNMLVKKPGEAEWVPLAGPKGSEVTSMWCPSRDPWDLVEKYPD